MDLQTLFGEGPELNALQMTVRAGLVFFITLVLLRVAGRRSFGQHSAFDVCVGALLGAVLSRAVVGASPFVPTIAAAATLVVLHRLLGMAQIRWPAIDIAINGRERLIARDGELYPDQMRAGLISERDLREALRKSFGDEDLAKASRATLERNGEITITKR